LVVVHLPLADAVRIIADPLGLTYRITDGAIHFAAVKEMPAGDMTSYRASAARRALREALLAFPGHALTPSACLELGNLEGAEGHLLEAAIWYERLIREMPGSANLVEAQFNLALVRDRQGELATARAAYYRVVDLAPAHELAPLAYYQVGRLHLDEADPQRALTPLRRALAVSPGSATEPAAAVALAAVHLLTDNPRVASAVLAEYRQAVARAPFRQTAAFLGALASLRSAGHSSEAKREGADLLTSLLGLGDGPLLGPMGRLLVGQAFHELGMDDPAVESYRKGLAESRGPLAEYLTFTLAESHFSAGTPAAARKLYSGLAAKETSSWNPSSRLRLAEIDLQERKPRDSVARCRKLLEDWKGWKELEIYKVMGQAFTQMGDHRRAAACFAGRVPNG
jgi:tetratricopeptide (TPR) repeat protein